MRELKRSMAKANMRELGFGKLFKKRRFIPGGPVESSFSRNWRKYVVVPPEAMKRAKKALARKTSGLPMGKADRGGGRCKCGWITTFRLRCLKR